MTKIKICGIRRQEDIEVLNTLLPDYCGFIINYPKSVRSLSPIEARELTCRLDRRVEAVGVFVNAPIELPVRMLREGVISLAQLHGSEDETYIRTLKEKTGRPVLKAFSIRTREDAARAAATPADYPLLDHALGANGQLIDWALLSECERPFFLAGGLGAENAAQAIEAVHPYAVDLNSALETNHYKDPEKMRRVVEAVRSLS